MNYVPDATLLMAALDKLSQAAWERGQAIGLSAQCDPSKFDG